MGGDLGQILSGSNCGDKGQKWKGQGIVGEEKPKAEEGRAEPRSHEVYGIGSEG